MKNQAFTLIELLVVVLIIGILAAIAVPYYYESVEKSTMQEAIINLKAIAQANDVFFLQNGRYANAYEMDKLDISIPGEKQSEPNWVKNRIKTKDFIYAPDCINNQQYCGLKASAQRLPLEEKYHLYISSKNILKCNIKSQANNIQTKLCDQINRDGHL